MSRRRRAPRATDGRRSDVEDERILPEDLPDEPIVILFDEDVLEAMPGDEAPSKHRRLARDKPTTAVDSAVPRSRALVGRARRIVGGFAAAAALGLAVTFAFLGFRQGLFSSFYPSPGELSSAHANIPGTPGTHRCEGCHDDSGVRAGCLACHKEIEEQIRSRSGYHSYLFNGNDSECTPCHREHLGRRHTLVDELSWADQDRDDFRHPHVTFRLGGRHEELECEECHEKQIAAQFSLPGFPGRFREHSHLGLRQACSTCHQDIHSGGLSTDCESCHGQDAFRPAVGFDHSPYFPLGGGHARVACKGCHILPAAGTDGGPRALPFEEVRGTRCEQCHESPHVAPFEKVCEECHTEPTLDWAAARTILPPDAHRLTGFPLEKPHETVDCEKCHPSELPYETRFAVGRSGRSGRSPGACEVCHSDVHGGQFLGKYPRCRDCHDRAGFQPHLYTKERHAAVFALDEAHADVTCDGCHGLDPATGVRRFGSTPTDCSGCHTDPHAGQFLAKNDGCEACHTTSRFVPASFGLDEHAATFPLMGSHVAVPCISCHVKGEGDVRMFDSTPTQCKSCHDDPHGEQFARELDADDCTACHSERADSFALPEFDHEQSTSYPLIGAHAEAECSECHASIATAASVADAPFAVYRGTPKECDSCHVDVHRGQFRTSRGSTCGACHSSTVRWSDLSFDHQHQSRFALDGAHVGLPCGSCHPRVRIDDSSELIQFKPLRTECNSCHDIQD